MYENHECVYQECVALIMWSKTNGNNCMIMRIKIHKTLRNHEKKNKEAKDSLGAAKSLRETLQLNQKFAVRADSSMRSLVHNKLV